MHVEPTTILLAATDFVANYSRNDCEYFAGNVYMGNIGGISKLLDEKVVNKLFFTSKRMTHVIKLHNELLKKSKVTLIIIAELTHFCCFR